MLYILQAREQAAQAAQNKRDALATIQALTAQGSADAARVGTLEHNLVEAVTTIKAFEKAQVRCELECTITW